MSSQRGVSLVEVVAMLAVMGIATGTASLYLRSTELPLVTATSQVEGLMRMARARAMATTSALRIQPDGLERLRADVAPDCAAATWSVATDLALELPTGVVLPPGAWSVCFGSRGIASDNVIVTLSHDDFGSRQVEVLLGGSTRVLP